MKDPFQGSEDAYNLAGWLLFVVCALFYIASSALSGDVYSLAGSLAFLVACVFFMIPLLRKMRRGEPRPSDPFPKSRPETREPRLWN